MEALFWLSMVGVGLYGLVVAYLLRFWESIPVHKVTENRCDNLPHISVVIAVKNGEAYIANLLKCFTCQILPTTHFEVIMVNDAGSDNSINIVKQFCQHHSIKNIRWIENDGTGKKAALHTGISQAKADIIVTTDVDCVFGNDWLFTYAQFFCSHKPYFVFAPVYMQKTVMPHKNIFFRHMQTIEFAALVGSGAALWRANLPTMCNGANLAFLKKIYHEIGGYNNHTHINSGDDEFLMHAIYKHHATKVYFLKSQSVVVFTADNPTLHGFAKQRLRWASKWEHYELPHVKGIAFFIFLSNLLTVALFAFMLGGNAYLKIIILLLLAARWVFEYIFIKRVLAFGRLSLHLPAFLCLVWLYPVYVIIFALWPRFFKNV